MLVIALVVLVAAAAGVGTAVDKVSGPGRAHVGYEDPDCDKSVVSSQASPDGSWSADVLWLGCDWGFGLNGTFYDVRLTSAGRRGGSGEVLYVAEVAPTTSWRGSDLIVTWRPGQGSCTRRFQLPAAPAAPSVRVVLNGLGESVLGVDEHASGACALLRAG